MGEQTALSLTVWVVQTVPKYPVPGDRTHLALDGKEGEPLCGAHTRRSNGGDPNPPRFRKKPFRPWIGTKAEYFCLECVALAGPRARIVAEVEP